MSDLELRVRVQAEVAAARAEIAAVRTDVVALGQASKNASGVSMQDLVAEFAGVRAGAGSARDSAMALLSGLDQVATGYDMLRAAVDPAYAATQRFADAQTMARMAVANGITTQDEAARTLDLLAQKLGLVEARSEQAGQALGRVHDSSGMAAASSANLAYQFNDVAMMAAAGQSPLMIAIQQGTQIGQVFGQAGAGGALAMLKGGFMAFLSPATLVTIALIAGGAALVQWAAGALGAAADTKTLEEAVGNLESAVSKFKTQSALSLDDLKEKFGEVTPEVVRLNEEMTNLAGAQAIIAATDALRSLKAETQGSWLAMFTDKQFTDLWTNAQNLGVEATINDPNGQGPVDNPIIQKFQDAVGEAASAEGWDNQIAAIRRVQDVIIEAAGGIDSMSLNQAELLAKVQATEVALRAQKAASDGSAVSAQGVAMWAAMANANIEAAAAESDDLSVYVRNAGTGYQSLNNYLARTSDTTAQVGIHTRNFGLGVQAANSYLIRTKAEADAIANANISAGISQAAAWAQTLWDRLSKAAATARAIAADPSLAAPGTDDNLRWQYGQYGMGRALADQATNPLFNPPPVPDAPAESGGTSGASSASVRGLTAEAAKSMSDLDLAVSAINEKVKAGLMTTSEAADAVTGAKDQAADSLAELVARLDQLGPSGSAAANTLRSNMKGLAADLKATGSELAANLSEGFKSPFKDFLKGTLDAEDAMDALGDMFADTLARMAADQAAASFIQPALGMIFSSVGSLFGGGGGAVTTSPIPPPAPHALGGVPDAPLSAYRNQVLDRPTLFPMARGMGLMAEAGAEAIMPVGDGGVLAMIGGREARLPLTRGAGGRLGVDVPDFGASIMERPPVAFAKGGIISGGQAMRVGEDALGGRSGGGGAAGDRQAPIVVNVTTPAGHTAKVEERRGSGGELNVDIMVELIENRMAGNLRSGRGAHAAAMADTFGLDRRPR